MDFFGHGYFYICFSKMYKQFPCQRRRLENTARIYAVGITVRKLFTAYV